MLEQLLGELMSLLGQGVVCYVALGAVLYPLLWLVHVANRPLARLDRWLKSKAHQPVRPRPEPPLRGYSGYDTRIR